MRPVYIILIGSILTALAVFIPIQRTYAAFGISPPFLNADHLVPGSKFSETIYLVQDQPNQDLNIQANLQVPDVVKSWFSIDRGFTFTIPQGMQQYAVTVTVSVPQNASIGVYHGTLTFNTAPSSAGQVTIALGAQVAVNLTIGNDVFEKFGVQQITFQDIGEGQNPLVDVKFKNDGNVPESFDGANFELYDRYDTVRLAYIQKSGGFPTTPPFTIQDYTVDFPTDFYLGIGEYWGIVTFYKNNQIIASQKTTFTVLKTDWLSKTERFIEKEWVWLLIGAALLALFVFLLIRRAQRPRQ
jgi:hypothetical protein